MYIYIQFDTQSIPSAKNKYPTHTGYYLHSFKMKALLCLLTHTKIPPTLNE